MSDENGDLASALNSPSVDSKIAAELEAADANAPMYSTHGATGPVHGASSSDSPQHNSARGFLKAPTARVAQSADGSFFFDDSYNAIVPFGRDRPSSASGVESGSPHSGRRQRPSWLSRPPAAGATESRGLLDDLTDAPEVVYRDSPRDRASFFTSPRRAHSEGATMREEKETLVRTTSAGRTTKTTTTTITSKVGLNTNRTTRVTQHVGGSATAWEGGAVAATSSSELRRRRGSHDAGTTERLDAGGSGDGLAGVGDDFTSVSGSDGSDGSDVTDDDNRADGASDAVASPVAAGCTSRVSRAVAAVRHDKSHGWALVWRRLIARITVALRAARALRRAEQNLRFRARRDGIEVAELMSRGTVATRIALELRHLMALYACWTQEAFDFAAIFDGFVKELPSIGAKGRGAMAMHVSCRRVIRKTGSTDAAGHVIVDDGSSFGRIAGGATSDLSGVVVPIRDASESIAFDLFPAGPTHTEDPLRMMLQPHMLPRKGRGEITIAFDWDFTVDGSVEPSPSSSMVARDDAKRHTALLHRRMLATEHERRVTAIATEEAASRKEVMAVFARQTARLALLRLEQTSRTPTLTPKAGSAISPAQRMRNEAAATTTAAGVAKVKTNRAAALLRERNARAPPKSSPPRSPGAGAAKPSSKASAPVPRTPPAAKSPSSRPRRSPSARMPSAGAEVKVNKASRAAPTASSGSPSDTASPPIMSWVVPSKTLPNDREPAAHSRTARPIQLDQSDEVEHSAAPDSSPGSLPVPQASLPQPEHYVPSEEDADGPSVLWKSRPGSRLRLRATVSHASRQSSAAPSRGGSPTHSEASGYRLERRPSRISFRCSPAAQHLAPSVHASAGPPPNDDASPDPRPLRVMTPEDDRVASLNRRRMSIRHLRERGNSVANSPQEVALVPVFPAGVRPVYSRSSLSSHASPTKPESAGPSAFRLVDGEGDVEDSDPADAGKSRILTDYVFGASVDSACDDDDGDAATAKAGDGDAAAKVGDVSPAPDGQGKPRRRVPLPTLRQPEPAHVATEAAKKQRLRTTLSMRRLRQEQVEDELVGQEGLQSDLFDPRAALAEAQRLRSQASRRDGVTRYNTSAAMLQHGTPPSSGYRARLQRTISASRSPSPALSLASQQHDQHHQHGDGEAKRVRHCTACANRKRVAEERVMVPGVSRTTSPKPRSISPSPVTPPLSHKSSDVQLPAIAGAQKNPPPQPQTRQPVRTRRSSSVVALRAALDGADL